MVTDQEKEVFLVLRGWKKLATNMWWPPNGKYANNDDAYFGLQLSLAFTEETDPLSIIHHDLGN